MPRPPPKGPQQAPGHLISKPPPPLPSSPHRRAPFWRRGSLTQARRKSSGGPLYENILPLGRRGGGRYGARDGGGRRGRRPPPLFPLPVPLSSPTQTPTTPSSPCRFYSSCSSASSTSSSTSSSSSSSSISLSRANSPSSCSSDSSYNSSLSFRYRAGDRDITLEDDYDSDLLTEESSLLLGSRRKLRSRRMSSRSLPCSPPPPPVPPRKPRPQRDYSRERTGIQLAQLQEWWASWGERERGRLGLTSRGEGGAVMGREEKRHHKERERERKRRKKGRKKKKREERERERERKRRKGKKKRKKDEKVRRRERKRSEQEEGDAEKREEVKVATPDYPSYPPLRRESFRKKSESSIRSYGWNIPGGDERREREEKERDDREDSRDKERPHRRRNSKQYHSSSSKPTTSVKFWGGGNPSSDTIPSAFLPLLPLSAKCRKSKGSEREAVGIEGEKRPLLGRDGRGEFPSKEGLSFHEWDSDVEDDEEDSELERRKAERGKRRGGGGRTMSEEERERDKVVGIYSDDDASSGEFGKFERYWEGHEGRAVGGIGGGGWFFGTYPSREKAGSVNSRDDLFLERAERWGTGESGWGSSGGGGGGGGEAGERGWGSGSHWPPPPLTPPPPRRYWSVDKLHIQDEKKTKRKSKDKGRGYAAYSSYHSPHHHAQSHSSKWARVTSRSQEELYHHCQSFGGPSKSKRHSSSSKPDRLQGLSKSGSQANLSSSQRTQRPDRDRDRGRQPSPPPNLIPNLPPPLPALPAPPSSSHSIHAAPPTSSSSVSSPSAVSSTPGAPQPASMASASAKLQYQRLRSVPQPQRFPQSPHLPLKAKSLCSRRGSAHFSSVESEV